MSPKHYINISIVTNNTNELEKLLGLQVFKNHNYNPFQFSLRLSINVSFSICCVTYTFL